MLPCSFANPPPPPDDIPETRSCIVRIFDGSTVEALYNAGIRTSRAVDGKGPPLRLSRDSDVKITADNMSHFILTFRSSCTIRFEQEELSWGFIKFSTCCSVLFSLMPQVIELHSHRPVCSVFSSCFPYCDCTRGSFLHCCTSANSACLKLALCLLAPSLSFPGTYIAQIPRCLKRPRRSSCHCSLLDFSSDASLCVEPGAKGLYP